MNCTCAHPLRNRTPDCPEHGFHLGASVKADREDPIELRASTQRYFLGQDDDGHWYVVPVDKRGEWEKWLARLGYTEAAPEWVESVGGSPCLVTFIDPQIS
jgi:hypothetical protein